MRQIASFPEEDRARTIADYLLTLHIETRVEAEDEGWALWVCDEDKVPRARQELEQFNGNPQDPRYSAATRTASSLRRQEARVEAEYSRRVEQLRERMQRVASESPSAPVVKVLIGLSIVVALFTGLGEYQNSFLFQSLTIASFRPEGKAIVWPGLSDLMHGQVWRLVTPIFLHFGIWHLLFNLFMLYQFGRIVESQLGVVRMILLVLVIAILSNLAEYYLAWSWTVQFFPEVKPSPLFGGMSGVLYGLFGFLWMHTRYDPSPRYTLDPTTVLILLGWFFLCLLGVIPHVANVAHGVGLIVGAAIGVAPHVWRSLRGQGP
jgi:GlpG protein